MSDDILREINPSAVTVYVGKQEGFHTRSQEEIHAMMCLFAKEGATVVRLKGGDPYIFGRGGEELEYLQERGMAIELAKVSTGLIVGTLEAPVQRCLPPSTILVCHNVFVLGHVSLTA